MSASGFLKIDGLPVDENRFGGASEPYKGGGWIDGKVAATGDFQRGEPIFRVRLCRQRHAMEPARRKTFTAENAENTGKHEER